MAEPAKAGGKPQRPLSPHLSIYKPQISSTLSILHRASGVVIGVGSLMLTCWLVALATGPEAFDAVQAFLAGPVGLIIMLGFTAAVNYHMLNGIRHLGWDIGRGYELSTMTRTGVLVVLGAAVLTGLEWACVIAMGGVSL